MTDSLTSARHKAVVERAGRRRVTRVALPALAATVVTGSVIGISLARDVAPDPSVMAGADIGAARSEAARSGAVLAADRRERVEDRQQSISRSARRVTIEDEPEPTGHRFSTTDLNIREAPAENADVLTTVDSATKLSITGEVDGDYAEVVWKERSYWVSADYLAKEKPEEEAAVSVGGFSTAPCANGSSIESGITANAVKVLRAVCAEFPMITTYGGWRGDGEHSDGRAIDVMVSGDLGWQVADYLRANSGALGLYDIIYSQKIWTAQRSAEGWRYMSDRGSVTANHYDHVHVKAF